ncbi:potassium-transporting ATPase subunit F [Magnetospirillum sp. 64-120]|nr:potassium-transporting ATPase subunit F [Magnetospirillum sp. 64-120]
MSDIDLLGIALGGAAIIGLLVYLGTVLIYPEQF